MTHSRMINLAIALVFAIPALILSETDCLASVTFRVVHFGQLVDNESSSYDCLSCHDHSSAKGVGFQIWKHGSSTNPLGNHPIEVTYPAEWSGNTRFALPADIEKSGLRLLDGKLACITCHDLRIQNNEYLLAVPLKGSELCFTCHRI